MTNIDISFIVPVFNAERKMARCLDSLNAVAQSGIDIEAIFIDDCSEDNSFERLSRFCSSEGRGWASVCRLRNNSGSPSGPRNLGLTKARGKYVYFLDIDDSLIVDGIKRAFDLAVKTSADLVRAPLVRENGGQRIVFNEVDWSEANTKVDRAALLIQRQSTTVGGLISRNLLVNHGIEWREDLRMGEDTLFLCEVLKNADRIEYSSAPDYLYQTSRVEGSVSSTQRYGDRELADHLEVWSEAERLMGSLNVSYYELRGQVALQNTILNLIHVNRGGVSRELFDEFAGFVQAKSDTIEKFNYGKRIQEVIDELLVADYAGFSEATKERLLIAGFDLKFIERAISHLEREYVVRVDRWSGHDRHDVSTSKELLEWAEVIHCEWLLGNAVWYSNNKLPGQKLIVRCHLFEMTREFGERICKESIDRFVVVSLPTLEDFAARFELPRERMRLIPNFIDTSAYSQGSSDTRRFTLGVVGILPARKGYHRAIQLLQMLKSEDPRYRLEVFGKMPSELPWVSNDPVESEYYAYCEKLVEEANLGDSIEFKGWQEMTTALAEVGFLLSVSDFESFHVAPAESFAAGNAALFIPWRGVEYIYPGEYIFDSLEDMKDQVLSIDSGDALTEFAHIGREWVKDSYDIVQFCRLYDEMVLNI